MVHSAPRCWSTEFSYAIVAHLPTQELQGSPPYGAVAAGGNGGGAHTAGLAGDNNGGGGGGMDDGVVDEDAFVDALLDA